jgi:hypothetical protein
VVELLDLLARLENGEVRVLEVRCGLPVSAEIEWAGDASVYTGYPAWSR